MTVNIWLLIFLMMLLTATLRGSFLLLEGRITFPLWLRRALRYVPYAVLPALALPAIISVEGSYVLDAPKLIAAVVGVLAAWRTRSVLPTLVFGMGALWLSSWLLSSLGS